MREKLTILFFIVSISAFSQNTQNMKGHGVGINTENPKATLDIVAVGNNARNGVLIPRVSKQDAENMTGVVESTVIYVNDINITSPVVQTADVDKKGFYYFFEGKWQKLGATNAFWSLTGNENITEPHIDNNYTITNDGNFLGTTKEQPVVIATHKIARLKIGDLTAQPVQANNFDFVLDVYGKARFRDGIVTKASSYPDYVFENYFTGESKENPAYSFKNLAEIEDFIKENHHLPGVTSIKDLNPSVDGYEVDNTQLSIQTLEKVEELYLHIIEQQKQIEALKAEIAKLKK